MVIMSAAAAAKEGFDRESSEAKVAMDMRPVRAKPLHNFKMPTPWLTWGHQKLLRCAKVNSSGTDQTNIGSFAGSEIDHPVVSGGIKRVPDFDFDSDSKQRSSPSVNVNHPPVPKLIFKNNRFVGVNDEGINAVRVKLTDDLKNAADNMKLQILKQNDEEEKEDLGPGESSAAAEVAAEVAAVEETEMPWNLRTRRAACKVPIENGKVPVLLSPMKTENNLMKSSRLRRGDAANGVEKTETRAKFSLRLTKKEIEEDYLMMIGEKPPKRPKKRSKGLQQHLDNFFPGLWLCEVTPDMYKVSELPNPKK